MSGRIVALSGGVGGAKLAQGLSQVTAPEELLIVAHTGDDFVHLGFHISPDVDTLLYTLGDVADRERGWGRADETWSFMDAVAALGGPAWFRLGDRDLATHVLRTQRLAQGATLSEATQELAARFGVRHLIAPMSDDPVRTIVHTDEGPLAFQDYFVRRQCHPRVHHLEFAGAASARPAPALAEAMRDEAARAIVVCPSNPYLSVDPILSVPGVRAWLEATAAPVIAVSPIIGGEAVK
ncbi:MAG TPA: 2-phospho-L-lactate transferase CofD family protein, partial [Steroidobacteraceae bacterium]|nr:2-phospho-L-lactate transferase CofD family protein [Steroidobacteraceae bacterium]